MVQINSKDNSSLSQFNKKVNQTVWFFGNFGKFEKTK